MNIQQIQAELSVSVVEAPKVTEFRQVSDNDNVLVTDLHVTPYVFGLNYAFCLIAQCLTVCPFTRSFCTTCCFGVTRLTVHPPYMWNDIFRRLDLLGQDIGHVITQAQFQ